MILITREKDDFKEELERLIQEVIVITRERDSLKGMVDHAEAHTTGRLDLVRALTWA